MTDDRAFAARLLAWYDVAGRDDLPWQHPRTPYRVWVSEVMLQQTQVATVIGYFDRFVQAFPDVRALAAASLDEVLARWQGLGYYSRARNLHRAARACVDASGGELPREPAQLEALPGIGRSTSAAIAAQAHGTRVAILDGNVKRVLSRHAGIDEPIDAPATIRALWREAEARLPDARLADYTQAIMDLGATVCTPRAPRCDACPVAADCVARATGRVDAIPRRKEKRATPTRAALMLVVRDREGRVLLERRADAGLWGGLYSLPQCDAGDAAEAVLGERYGLAVDAPRVLAPFTHAFTHFRLAVQPLAFTLRHERDRAADGDGLRWIARDDYDRIGMPRPVRALLDRLGEP